MPSGINSNDPRPPYVQIADDLRRAIMSGEMPPDEKLRSGRDLATAYNVAPMTVHQAIRILRDEGLVESFQGRGVFVRGPGSTRPAGTRTSGEPLDWNTVLARLDDLDERLHARAPQSAIDDIQEEVADLRKQLAILQTQMIDLYSRVGQPYPRETRTTSTKASKRAAGE